jgi:hypothetical protein
MPSNGPGGLAEVKKEISFNLDTPCSLLRVDSTADDGGGMCVPTSEHRHLNKVVSTAEGELSEAMAECDSQHPGLASNTLCKLKVATRVAKSEVSEMAKKFIVKYFKPATKSYSGNYWLNNTEIDTLQYQLSSQFPGYYYTNIHMIDFGMFEPTTKDLFDSDVFPLVSINFPAELSAVAGHQRKLTYNSDMKYFGCVFNTDVSTGQGIHWFSIFMDFSAAIGSSTPWTIEYFNSSGMDIRRCEFKSFFMKLADDISVNVHPTQYIKVTSIQHQRSDTSNCGAYSLYYIWKRLNGTPWSWFKKNKVNDESMQLFRRYILSKESGY